MSDNWIVFVPADPHALPGRDAVEAARRAVERALPAADEVTAEVSADPQFIDAGANFESVCCPACTADVRAWWEGAMERAHASGFRDLSAVTPCCGAATTLNDLVYDWPQAFGRVSIHAMNPDVGDLPAGLREEVERHLGLPARIVRQHI